jgi:hypothetical protein
MSENDTTITISKVQTDEGDRVLIAIDSESGLGDFARIYLHPETVEALRVALAPEPAIRTWTVVFGDGEIYTDVLGETAYTAITRAAAKRWRCYHVEHVDEDRYWGARDLAPGYDVVRFTATATPATTERA